MQVLHKFSFPTVCYNGGIYKLLILDDSKSLNKSGKSIFSARVIGLMGRIKTAAQ